VGVTRPDVLVPIATLAKGLGAEETAIRLFAGVDALVVLEGVRPVEALAALLALVATLAAMDQTVLVEDGSCEEALSTHQAEIRTLARVALADVVVQIRSNGELPVTVLFLADKRLDT